MTRYRIYVLNAQDRIASLNERFFRCETEALRSAEELRADEYAAEVWTGEHLVARIGGNLELSWAA